jgi:hypothetical protein
MRYAVSVYGIGQDYDENGHVMGLTFGPATGADYVNTYKDHSPTGMTTGGHGHRCVHDDSWDEIIYWNNVDPDVYEQCVGECCTKSVPLNLSDTLKNTGFQVKYTGDGPGLLKYELYANSNFQHLRWNPLTEGGSSSWGTNKNGWGGSRIRAMLNGADSETLKTSDSAYATDVNFDVSAVEDYTSENCLLASFPENLQTGREFRSFGC